jgi:hypothetical protein
MNVSTEYELVSLIMIRAIILIDKGKMPAPKVVRSYVWGIVRTHREKQLHIKIGEDLLAKYSNSTVRSAVTS